MTEPAPPCPPPPGLVWIVLGKGCFGLLTVAELQARIRRAKPVIRHAQHVERLARRGRHVVSARL